MIDINPVTPETLKQKLQNFWELSGRKILAIRITSYNVCYTKLLRTALHLLLSPVGAAIPCVITSYSIHYTKLYDRGIAYDEALAFEPSDPFQAGCRAEANPF